jgi:glycosyltransferase involved in cell wall biosynthesis
MSFFPLKKILKKNEPDYLIIHLITSLPLILLILFNFKTKFILRISGYPKMNFLRKFLWRKAFKKIYLITCPTNNTLNYIKSLNLVDDSKLKLLYDPVINIKEINKKKDEKIDSKDYFLSIGRLTKQKNFMFLCEGFKNLVKENNQLKLVIAGNGEDDKKIRSFIKKNKLKDNIILLGYVDNIYPYFVNSKGFILTSLWEDPGFVLIEAFFCKKPILSSNSWPGPVELINHLENGFVFENKNLESFIQKFRDFDNYKDIRLITLNGLKTSKKFTLFSHYKNLNKLLSIN